MPESGSWGLRWDAEFDCETTHQGDHDGLMRERAAPRVVCASAACLHVGLLNRLGPSWRWRLGRWAVAKPSPFPVVSTS